MKLHCPHCGVKGSAEDSYRGRKVKCPKCQGVFEVTPDKAVELPEDSTLLSGLSSTPAELSRSLDEVEIPTTADEEFSETGVDEALSVAQTEELVNLEEDLAEPESEITSPAEEEDSLDWEDIASEIDLQLAQGELGEGLEETLERDPVDSSFFQDEFATPAGDLELSSAEDSEIGNESSKDSRVEGEGDQGDQEEIEINDLTEESLLPDSVDSESSGQKIENDLEESVSIAESYEEGVPEGEVQLVEEPEEIELEPYGIDKEQCWQCGKDGSFGEPFIAKDGRLYCTDCAPIGDQEAATEINQEQGEGDALYAPGLSVGEADLANGESNEIDNKFSIAGAIKKWLVSIFHGK